MLIKKLPKHVRELALQRQKDQGNPENELVQLNEDKNTGNFTWEETPEGYLFWACLSNEGTYAEACKHLPEGYPLSSIGIIEDYELF